MLKGGIRRSKGQSTKGAEYKDGVATVLAPSSFCPLGEPLGDGYVRVMHPAFLNGPREGGRGG